MPVFSTAVFTPPFAAARRRAKTSGHRLLVSAVDPAPSVIESPSVTTAAVRSFVLTSTRSRKNHDGTVDASGRSAAPALFPAAT